MDIIEERRENEVLLLLKGRLDVNASERLEKEVTHWLSLEVVKKLILDMENVEYISSAAIRVLLYAQKNLHKDHELIIRSPSKFCRQVFEVTGADIFLKIVM